MTGPTTAPLRITAHEDTDGGVRLTNDTPLGPLDDNVGQWLRRWAEETPDAVLLAEPRDDGGWRRWRYGEALDEARATARRLLATSDEPPRVVLLAGNGRDHLRVALACQLAGIPYTPVSQAYATGRDDFAGLRRIADLLDPTVVVATPAQEQATAVLGDELGDGLLVVPTGLPDGTLADESTLAAAEGAIGHDTIAKLLLTSGSTGRPKAVMTTHGMLVANQAQITHIWPFVREEPPVLVDWLPWSHTFGGSHDVNLVLRNGGTLHLDPGGPTPAGIDASIAANVEVGPTIHFDVPAGYQQLLPRLLADPDLATRFMRNVRFVFNASAPLTPVLRGQLDELIGTHAPRPVPLFGGYGSTETAPSALSTRTDESDARSIGVPLPGVEARLVPIDDDASEIQLRGPNVFDGYLDDPERTAEVLLDDGWYRTGDLGALLDEEDATRGLVFVGRAAENFKLSTGTWVRVAELREAVLDATDPLLHDLVVAGEGADDVRLLVWPGDDRDGDDADWRDDVRSALRAYNRTAGGSSRRVAEVLVLATPPTGDEVTDKGELSQRRALTNRADDVATVYEDGGDPRVLCLATDQEQR